MRQKSKSIIFIIGLISSLALASVLINDPYYADQWHLNQNMFLEYGDYDIGFQDFKDSGIQEVGETITVIFGAGMKTDHEDLVNSLWVNTDEIPGNNIDDDLNGFVDDIHGVDVITLNGDIHDLNGLGTAAAGIVAAEQNNNLGIVGISKTTKIAYCKYWTEDPQNTIGLDEALSKCVDFVLNLKNVKNKVISSVLYDSGVRDSFISSYTIQVLSPIFQRLRDNDILLVAPAPFEDSSLNVDLFNDYPYSYLQDNVLFVGGIDHHRYISSGYGENSIGVVAPSTLIRSTSIYDRYISNGDNIAVFEQADIPIENLTNVTISVNESTTGSQSWKFDLGPEAATLALNELDLTAYKDQELVISFDNLGLSNDAIEILFYNWQFSRWEYLYYRADPGNTWHSFSKILTLGPNTYESISRFKIKFVINGFGGNAGISYIDNIKLFSISSAISVDDYGNVQGSLMSAALVAGEVALLKSTTNYSNWQIRNLLMSSGETIETIDGILLDISLSNKYTKIIGDTENGILNCNNQTVQRRIFPASEFWIPRVLGKEFIVKGVKLNCELSGGDLAITDSLTGITHLSRDDGVGLDYLADDGFNITEFNFQTLGKHTLTIENDSDLVVYASYPYQVPKKTNAIWSNLGLANEFFDFYLPFRMNYGGLHVGVSDTFNFSASIGSFFITQNISAGNGDGNGELKPNKVSARLSNFIENKFTKPIDKQGRQTVPYDPNFVANGIADEDKEFVHLFPFLFPNGQSGVYWFDKKNFIYGAEGSRVVVLDAYPNPNIGDEFTANFQLMFFEKNSTFIFSYKNFSDNLISEIVMRGMTIGSNYELLINDAFENDVSYILKEDDGVNVAPELINNVVEIYPNSEINIDLNSLYVDADNDTLIFSSNNSLPYLNLDGLGVLTSTLTTELQVGDQVSLQVSVTDAEESRLDNLIVKVVAIPNEPPNLSLDSISLNTSEAFLLNLANFTSDPEGQEVTTTLVNPPHNFELSTSGLLTGKLMKSDLPLSDNQLVFELSDGVNLVQKSILIELFQVNHKPEQVKPFEGISFVAGETVEVSLTSYFTDIDEDSLDFSTNSSIAQILVKGNEKILSISSLLVGTTSFLLRVDDLDGGIIDVELQVQVKSKPVPVTETSGSSGGGSLDLINLLFLCLLLLIARKKYYLKLLFQSKGYFR